MSPDAAGALRAAFDELGRLSFADQSLESVLQRVSVLAAGVLAGEPVTSVTIVDRGRASTVAASGELALSLDETQYRLGSGPCLAAATAGRSSEIRDTRAATEWPDFAEQAAKEGCRSVLSFPFPALERVSGALNVYARRFTAPDPATLGPLARFGAYAVVPVSNMYLYESAIEKSGHLLTALDSRGVIDQAKGILMERFRLTADQAFQVLARISMETNTKVRDVAERLVATGELPTG